MMIPPYRLSCSYSRTAILGPRGGMNVLLEITPVYENNEDDEKYPSPAFHSFPIMSWAGGALPAG